MFSLSISVV